MAILPKFLLLLRPTRKEERIGEFVTVRSFNLYSEDTAASKLYSQYKEILHRLATDLNEVIVVKKITGRYLAVYLDGTKIISLYLSFEFGSFCGVRCLPSPELFPVDQDKLRPYTDEIEKIRL